MVWPVWGGAVTPKGSFGAILLKTPPCVVGLAGQMTGIEVGRNAPSIRSRVRMGQLLTYSRASAATFVLDGDPSLVSFSSISG